MVLVAALIELYTLVLRGRLDTDLKVPETSRSPKSPKSLNMGATE